MCFPSMAPDQLAPYISKPWEFPVSPPLPQEVNHGKVNNNSVTGNVACSIGITAGNMVFGQETTGGNVVPGSAEPDNGAVAQGLEQRPR